MKLATFLLPGAEAPTAGEVRGDAVVAFPDGATVVDRLASGDLAPAEGEAHPLDAVRLLAPVPRPRAIFGVGLNYAAHARETGQEPPPAPMIFLKLPSSAAAPNDDVAVPEVARRRLDYEGELAVVIGAGGTIAGYAVADDLSARHLQKREKQWTRAKGFDNSCPYGPWITTADEIDDPSALMLRTWVNEELRQESSTADLIFGVREIVDFLSETCTLEPGDVILTGTPSGVGQALDPPRFLEVGDRVRIHIDGLGTIDHAIA
jgi:2-keto-4-pentenoate hydratase/2-oxohepta-3-ene-1,7-dioic acid hydratase in catechol pathway